jgi:hypothetical protein
MMFHVRLGRRNGHLIEQAGHVAISIFGTVGAAVAGIDLMSASLSLLAVY